MSKLTWEAVPTMSEEYFSENNVFEKTEDICREEFITGATDEVWLKFTSKWTWPGPQVRLIVGPGEVQPRMGIRAIPYGSIKVEIIEACKKAFKVLKETDGGDKFVGTIQLYWPLVRLDISPEPYYVFTTNAGNVMHVGAYSGEVIYPGK